MSTIAKRYFFKSLFAPSILTVQNVLRVYHWHGVRVKSPHVTVRVVPFLGRCFLFVVTSSIGPLCYQLALKFS